MAETEPLTVRLARQERARMEAMVRDGDHEGLRAYLQEYVDGLEHLPLEDTAFHEAGHAVAGHRLGHGIVEARIDGNGKGEWGQLESVAASFGLTGGCVVSTEWDYRPALPARPNGLYTETELVNAARPNLVCSLAGPVAEARHLGVESLRDCTDLAHVKGWLRKVVRPDDFESAATWLVEHACWLVDESWDAIGLVAHGLLEHRVLSGEQVAKLVGQD